MGSALKRMLLEEIPVCLSHVYQFSGPVLDEIRIQDDMRACIAVPPLLFADQHILCVILINASRSGMIFSFNRAAAMTGIQRSNSIPGLGASARYRWRYRR